ncbi:hypothetical protein JYJ95_02230 [Corallococcus exiguus]|uniref:hypothetical protein n=1 Tax=Corallococcus exiguus TaxID=83462 RepID=UPI001A8F58F9|nr:hypothetical protein [Corallococcus exiguus]MBN8465311.1 hypothetical protein [Corallococcus exiguus]
MPHLETTPGSRLRHWASRLLLLFACASVVATSRNSFDDIVSEPYTSKPSRLTTGAPGLTRPLTVKLTASKPPAKPAQVQLTVQVKARWTPADPSRTMLPWMRVSLSKASPDPARPTQPVVLKTGEDVMATTVAILDETCEMGPACAWVTDLTVQVQPDAPPGTVELEWKAVARAKVNGLSDTPEGMTVTVSEP